MPAFLTPQEAQAVREWDGIERRQVSRDRRQSNGNHTSERQVAVDTTAVVNKLMPVAIRGADELRRAIDEIPELRPKEVPGSCGLATGLPAGAVEPIKEVLTALVADLIEYYIDVGSEREVTQENLGPHIENELWGWCADRCADAPKREDGCTALSITEHENEVYRRELGCQRQG